MSWLAALRRWRRARAASRMRVPEAMWRAVEAGLPFLDYLPAADRPRLRLLALEFLAAKEMTGARGVELTGEARLGIALQACLPILNLGLASYEGWVGIVVYPGDFRIPRRLTDEQGIVHEYDEAALGEAWEGGPVLVSWGQGAGGVNVVIHEFAHKLDMANGATDGMPPLHAGMSREAWAKAFRDAYAEFCRFVDEGGDPWLDPYAAESPSEFFAVASEAFFETPGLLREDMPAVYEQMRLFYRQDPAAGEERVRALRA
ncbi:MAG: zinc-dependent peptidase [Rhodocyclaceae bacterium]